MGTLTGHHRITRPSIVLAAVLSCTVVCAAVVGAISVPFVGAVVVLAAMVGLIGVHERQPASRVELFSASTLPQSGPVKIDAPRARQATPHSDVA